MEWKAIAFLLCAYGLLKEFKPIEPYLYRYQNIQLNISGDVLNSEVYPYWTYSYLLLSIPVLLLTDLLLYKPILVIESVAFIGVWLTLIFGRSVFSQKFGQILYGLATATEVAYFAYAYVKIDREKYSIVTAWTRAALQFGKCFGYLLAQLILLFGLGDYTTLNYISLSSLSLTFLFALALPSLNWRSLIDHKSSKEGVDSVPENYGQFAAQKIEGFCGGIKRTFSHGPVLRWSIWWAMATCGDLQIGNYIQLLWGQTQMGMEKNGIIYNGFVEAFIPLLSALTLMAVGRMKLDWSEWGELALAGTAFLQSISLVGMSFCGNLFLLYAGYAICRVLYQISITVAQFNIATRIEVSSSGVVFGLNMFIALLLQALLTLLVVDSHGPFQMGIRTQFTVYGAYHALISIIFLLAQSFRQC